jgi:hypothetical protein
MEKDFRHSKTEIFTRVCIKTVTLKDLDNIIGKMELLTKENLLKV